MPRSTFEAAAALCNLKSTTYTPQKWFWVDEPLIDFSHERDPKAAHKCFDEALSEAMAKTNAEHVGFIWAHQE